MRKAAPIQLAGLLVAGALTAAQSVSPPSQVRSVDEPAPASGAGPGTETAGWTGHEGLPAGAWEAVAAEGVSLTLSPLPPGAAGGSEVAGGSGVADGTGQAGPPGRGGAIRLAIDFQGHGGYGIARRRLDLDLPDNYQFVFWVRGEAPPENLELKLIDASGDNVWWSVRRDFAFPAAWQRIVVKKRHLTFAWGPAGGGDIRHAGALEIAISAGRGGRGVVDLAGFTFEPLPPPHPYDRRPVATASSSAPGREPAALALDGGAGRAGGGGGGGWHSLAGPPAEQWLDVDFLERRELGGLAIDWDRDDFATRYAVLTSDDGEAWWVARTVDRGDVREGGRSFLYLPETDARHVRLRLLSSSRGRGYGICKIAVLPVELSASPNAFFAAVAKASPRGSYPRAIAGEQSLWTLVGVDGGHDQGLLDQDGRLEAGSGGFSVEPFVLSRGELVGWSGVRPTPSLAAGYLPIPSVRWRRAGLAFEVTAFAAGPRDSPVLYARYRLRNRTAAALRPRLFLVLRPFQVDPPSQWLGRPGGVVEVRRIAFDGRAVEVTVGAERARRTVLPLAPAPVAFGAMTFDEGPVVDLLRRGRVPAAAGVEDPFGYATAALAYDLRLAPGAAAEVSIAIPLPAPAGPTLAATADVEPGPSAPARLERLLRQVATGWRARLGGVGGVSVRLPPAAGPLLPVLRTALAHVLISRDGPALRPGTRSYARSWIRDGALISDALLRLGMAREVREFAAWYASYQQPGGKVPCCVDARGADPVPENDSHGELLFLLGSYYRFTGDRAFLEAMWEHVAGAVAAIDALRQERRTEVFRQPEKAAFFGLLPESISHEGYSAHPVHSYWDDFFALRGLADAADLARALGKDDLAARWAAMRDELRSDLHASLRRTIAGHGLDYIPGSVELADFDPTSTAIAVTPGGELANLPAAALRHTFERYYQDVERRRRLGDWTSYTPYELRNVGVFIRLGWRERARQLLADMIADRRPPGWNQWPEVVWRDPRYPGFLGDLPHAWVAAEYIRAVLDLLAYEREADHALVLAAGVPASWARDGGVAVAGLRTPYGTLSYTLAASRSWVRLRIAGGLRVPPGGIAIGWPYAGEVTVNGRPAALAGGGAGRELIVRELPADVRLRLQGAAPQAQAPR
ncbi:MAG TPA: discoidin domain-containing protein [Thermoanaerobaculia bacterium]|nr:discoidin domain-containing protein [Thermoanaerobaculia bacterium]